ncbi:MAG: Na+/melibiose symporter-like transporter [Phycisphaerales bacterium]|jgi:Na+/melibiose symporter-like transporter
MAEHKKATNENSGFLLQIPDTNTTMMMFLFLLFAITMLLAWFGKKKTSVVTFIVTIVLCAFWFKHHATDTLHIYL